jgi:hypothetical protein
MTHLFFRFVLDAVKSAGVHRIVMERIGQVRWLSLDGYGGAIYQKFTRL